MLPTETLWEWFQDQYYKSQECHIAHAVIISQKGHLLCFDHRNRIFCSNKYIKRYDEWKSWSTECSEYTPPASQQEPSKEPVTLVVNISGVLWLFKLRILSLFYFSWSNECYLSIKWLSLFQRHTSLQWLKQKKNRVN